MLAQSTYNRLTTAQRRVLVRHVGNDGPVRYAISSSDAPPTLILLRQKLLRSVSPPNVRLWATVLTEMGREAACRVLAEYAEALIGAGLGESTLEAVLSAKTPMERPQEMKKLRHSRWEQLTISAQAPEMSTEPPLGRKPDL